MPFPKNDPILAKLEEYGPNQVGTLMTSGNIPGAWNVGFVTEWLATKDQKPSFERIPPKLSKLK